jgi:hypothetical protein
MGEKMTLVKAVRCCGTKTTGGQKTQTRAMDAFPHRKQAFDYAYDLYCLVNVSNKMSHYDITTDNLEIAAE